MVIGRDALTQYPRAQDRPWPRSLTMGENADPSVTSENVKEWFREQWRQEMRDANEAEVEPPRC